MTRCRRLQLVTVSDIVVNTVVVLLEDSLEIAIVGAKIGEPQIAQRTALLMHAYFVTGPLLLLAENCVFMIQSWRPRFLLSL